MINSLDDLRPGDLMIGPIGGLVGVGVGLGHLATGHAFRVGKRTARHMGIVTSAGPIPLLAQAMPGGAEVIKLTKVEHWTARHMYVRLPEDYPGQGEDAASIARLMVSEGVGYSFASYLALAAWNRGFKVARLEKWIDRRRPAKSVRPGEYTQVTLPCEAICSVFVDQAWSVAGKRVMEGVSRQCVIPGQLAGQLWSREGVTWSLPGAPRATTWTV